MDSSKLSPLFLVLLFTSSCSPLLAAGTTVTSHCATCGGHLKPHPPKVRHPKPPHPKHPTPKPVPCPPVGPVTPVTPTPVPPTPVTPAPVFPTPSPPPPPPPASCPVDSLKIGACVDLLGGLIHVGLGDPVANQCCPLLQGLVELEAAVCLCTTIKLKLLNINIYLPLALQLLLTCGKTPPPGYTCSL